MNRIGSIAVLSLCAILARVPEGAAVDPAVREALRAFEKGVATEQQVGFLLMNRGDVHRVAALKDVGDEAFQKYQRLLNSEIMSASEKAALAAGIKLQEQAKLDPSKPFKVFTDTDLLTSATSADQVREAQLAFDREWTATLKEKYKVDAPKNKTRLWGNTLDVDFMPDAARTPPGEFAKSVTLNNGMYIDPEAARFEAYVRTRDRGAPDLKQVEAYMGEMRYQTDKMSRQSADLQTRLAETYKELRSAGHSDAQIAQMESVKNLKADLYEVHGKQAKYITRIQDANRLIGAAFDVPTSESGKLVRDIAKREAADDVLLARASAMGGMDDALKRGSLRDMAETLLRVGEKNPELADQCRKTIARHMGDMSPAERGAILQMADDIGGKEFAAGLNDSLKKEMRTAAGEARTLIGSLGSELDSAGRTRLTATVAELEKTPAGREFLARAGSLIKKGAVAGLKATALAGFVYVAGQDIVETARHEGAEAAMRKAAHMSGDMGLMMVSPHYAALRTGSDLVNLGMNLAVVNPMGEFTGHLLYNGSRTDSIGPGSFLDDKNLTRQDLAKQYPTLGDALKDAETWFDRDQSGFVHNQYGPGVDRQAAKQAFLDAVKQDYVGGALTRIAEQYTLNPATGTETPGGFFDKETGLPLDFKSFSQRFTTEEGALRAIEHYLDTKWVYTDWDRDGVSVKQARDLVKNHLMQLWKASGAYNQALDEERAAAEWALSQQNLALKEMMGDLDGADTFLSLLGTDEPPPDPEIERDGGDTDTAGETEPARRAEPDAAADGDPGGDPEPSADTGIPGNGLTEGIARFTDLLQQKKAEREAEREAEERDKQALISESAEFQASLDRRKKEEADLRKAIAEWEAEEARPGTILTTEARRDLELKRRELAANLREQQRLIERRQEKLREIETRTAAAGTGWESAVDWLAGGEAAYQSVLDWFGANLRDKWDAATQSGGAGWDAVSRERASAGEAELARLRVDAAAQANALRYAINRMVTDSESALAAAQYDRENSWGAWFQSMALDTLGGIAGGFAGGFGGRLGSGIMEKELYDKNRDDKKENDDTPNPVVKKKKKTGDSGSSKTTVSKKSGSSTKKTSVQSAQKKWHPRKRAGMGKKKQAHKPKPTPVPPKPKCNHTFESRQLYCGGPFTPFQCIYCGAYWKYND